MLSIVFTGPVKLPFRTGQCHELVSVTEEECANSALQLAIIGAIGCLTHGCALLCNARFTHLIVPHAAGGPGGG